MALFSDWLQGPFVYKLYSHYGFAQGQIAILYLTGFASSVTFGTATGPLADKFGRKKLSLVFCILYSICCLTKLSPDFYVLLAGRVLGGISTSVLFSVFESWYIHQHTITYKYPIDWLSITFSKATFFNGLLAIIAGVVADVGADRLQLGPVSPFMFAIPCLVVALFIINSSWEENYGSQELNWGPSCMEGLQTILRTPHILVLGLIQSLFESNMYIFVFMWTPVLEPGKPPLGLTFSCFMIAIMVGSSLYSTILTRTGLKSEKILTLVLFLMSFAMFSTAILTNPVAPKMSFADNPEETIRITLIFLMFLVLEVSVGMYFPAIGTLRGEVIPDALRANITNWFRVPMNILTCMGLMGMHQFEHPRANQTLFFICGISSLVGLFLTKKFIELKGASKKSVFSVTSIREWKSDEKENEVMLKDPVESP
jgi:MFS family permease